MAKIRTQIISTNDPQPVECPLCQDFHGYSATEQIKTTYSTRYSVDGDVVGGDYGDTMRRTDKKPLDCYCINCNKILPFKLRM